MRFARAFVRSAVLLSLFFPSSCASSHQPIVDEGLRSSPLFQLEMMGVRSYSMLSFLPISDGQVFYGRTFSLYLDNGVIKIYHTDFLGELKGEPVITFEIGKEKKVLLLGDIFNSKNYVVVVSANKEDKQLDIYRINENLLEPIGSYVMNFTGIFVSGRFLLFSEKNQLHLYSFENETLALIETTLVDKSFKVFASHPFQSFIVIKESGECIVLGEENGTANVSSYYDNAALYYDGKNKKIYVVIFNKDGEIIEMCEVK